VDPVVHDPAEQIVHPLARPLQTAQRLDLRQGQNNG
jgi:hypothetical protein